MNQNRTLRQTDPLLHKLSPQNIEAEASLFSAILLDNRILNEILDILRRKFVQQGIGLSERSVWFHERSASYVFD